MNSQSLQFALRCLDTAYVNFFRGNAKFPRFKSRKKKNSFTVPQFAKLEGGRFFVPKFKEGINDLSVNTFFLHLCNLYSHLMTFLKMFIALLLPLAVVSNSKIDLADSNFLVSSSMMALGVALYILDKSLITRKLEELSVFSHIV